MYARAKQVPQNPTKARICVPDAVYDLEDQAAILNAMYSTFSVCLGAWVEDSANQGPRHANKPIKAGVETGLNGLPEENGPHPGRRPRETRPKLANKNRKQPCLGLAKAA